MSGLAEKLFVKSPHQTRQAQVINLGNYMADDIYVSEKVDSQDSGMSDEMKIVLVAVAILIILALIGNRYSVNWPPLLSSLANLRAR